MKTNQLAGKSAAYYAAINWNQVEDMIDKHTWDKANSQFWLDTRIPVSNDLDDWRALGPIESDTYAKVFAGLTLLDTIQSQDGNRIIQLASRTPQEFAVFNQITYMESVHAKSYSTVFSSLLNKREINEVFEWVNNNEPMQKKAKIIDSIYKYGADHPDDNIAQMKVKVASVFLESGLFYSGFYMPLWYLGNNKLINAAEIIKLILRDESLHGTYIGYKFQLAMKDLEASGKQEQADELRAWVYELAVELYENEEEYVKELYYDMGWEEDVNIFVRYNFNKALMNMGIDPIFPDTAADVNPIVMNGISTGSSNHDFFSNVGNSYLIGIVEAMRDSDYDV